MTQDQHEQETRQPLSSNPCGLPRRLAAIIYDSLLVLALMFLLTLPFIAVRDGNPVETGDNLIYRLCLAGLVIIYFTGYWSRTGRTLGMQSWGLRVETMDGQVPGFAAACTRFAVALLSWLTLGLGFVWQLWDRDKLTWHDRLSSTRLRHYPKPKKSG